MRFGTILGVCVEKRSDTARTPQNIRFAGFGIIFSSAAPSRSAIAEAVLRSVHAVSPCNLLHGPNMVPKRITPKHSVPYHTSRERLP